MTAGGFKDHFSGHAEAYARSRPRYPEALFRFLADRCARHELAWDCATGNGQAARSLAPYFERVVATDASAGQIEAAAAANGIEFRVAPAEASGLEPGTVDLVTCAQALHWFDIDAFFAEARRVLAPGGVLAAWCYGNCVIDPACDRVVQGFYRALDPWWPPEREIVESGYAGIELPFDAIDAPRFTMQVEWSAAALLDYVGSWSATERCRKATGREPLEAVAPALERAWGTGLRTVTWPLFLKVGRRA